VAHVNTVTIYFPDEQLSSMPNSSPWTGSRPANDPSWLYWASSMGGSLTDQVAIVTGASSGIGRAAALALAREGAAVALAARRAERLEEVAAAITGAGGRALAVPTDVARERQVAALVARAVEAFGGIDILVNAAGVAYLAPLAAIDRGELERLFAVNLFGAISACQHAAPHMLARGRGFIANVGSVSGLAGWAGGGPYVASKFALRGFTQCLWQELRAGGVRVCHLAPNYTDTEMLARAGASPAVRVRALRAEDVASAIVFAACLPAGADVVELELRPTELG